MKRIFSKIAPGWDHDLHVHSNWSEDIKEVGPNASEYLEIAQKYKIHVGFLEHFELLHEKDKDRKLNVNTIDAYLEEIDELKNNYDNITTGLEVDYYKEFEGRIAEFIDDYKNSFDFLAGSMHEVELYYPVTQPIKLKEQIKKMGSFDKVVNTYFEKVEQMISSGLFSAIVHPDVIYRFCSKEYVEQHQSEIDKRVIKVLKPCIDKRIMIEVNVSGLFFKIGRIFPSETVINNLLAEGATFFVGSDSHFIKDFKVRITEVRKAHYLIAKANRL